jgi:hypothetical protein
MGLDREDSSLEIRSLHRSISALLCTRKLQREEVLWLKDNQSMTTGQTQCQIRRCECMYNGLSIGVRKMGSYRWRL